MVRDDCTHLQRHSRRFAARAGVAAWILQHDWPRTAMTVVITASVAVWFGLSEGLRWCGVSAMWLRYPVALVPAYALLLIILGLLARDTGRRLDSRRELLRRHSLRHQWHSEERDELTKFNDFVDDFSEGMRQADHGDGGAALPVALMMMLSATVVLVCTYFIWMAPIIIGELVVE